MNTFSTASQVMNDPKEVKRMKLEAIRDYHQPLIDDLGINRLDFNMKMVFYNRVGTMVVGIFASEFKKEKGLFFELVDREFEPTDENRTVYRIVPNDNFHEEYEQNEKGSYLVPLEELRTVNKDSVHITKSQYLQNIDQSESGTQKLSIKPTSTYKAPATMEDAPTSEMTIRDYMAIHTGKPVSGKAWLNDLIKSSLK